MPLTIRSATGEHLFTVAVAATPEQQEHGLMFYRSLGADQGMIFPYDPPAAVSFWMKNTLIPLDMIWIDAEKKVVAVHHDVPPCKADPCPSYSPDAKGSYVLELAAGAGARHKVVVGSVLKFQGLDNVIVR